MAWNSDLLLCFDNIFTWQAGDDQHELTSRMDMLMARIRHQLRRHPKHQIPELLRVVDCLMNDYFSIENEWKRLEESIDEHSEANKNNLQRQEMFGVDVANFLRLVDIYDLNSSVHDKAITWAEIFTVAALQLLGWAIWASTEKDKKC